MSQTTPGLLVHNVFFSLKEPTDPNRRALVDACHRYLRQHEGIVFFACGVLAEALNRDVNVRDFDVGLHIAFTDQAAHDRYQEHPLHIQFVEENKPNWRQVRVFDSVVPGAAS
jgi:Stress responsive A/B Barrel Domain